MRGGPRLQPNEDECPGRALTSVAVVSSHHWIYNCIEERGIQRMNTEHRGEGRRERFNTRGMKRRKYERRGGYTGGFEMGKI